MYTVTCIRRGKYLTPNMKGKFKKTFNTLDEIAKFYVTSNNKIFSPFIKKELTKREFGILCNKINSQLYINK